jgi:hypothetical protein
MEPQVEILPAAAIDCLRHGPDPAAARGRLLGLAQRAASGPWLPALGLLTNGREKKQRSGETRDETKPNVVVQKIYKGNMINSPAKYMRKKIEKRGNTLNGMKINVTCLEFYFCEIDVRNKNCET